jgi:hypothetical protein
LSWRYDDNIEMNPSELGLEVTDRVLDPATDYCIECDEAAGSIMKTALSREIIKNC